MANSFIDSASSINITSNIDKGKTNKARFTLETGKLRFGEITFDDPMSIPRQFWDIMTADRYSMELQKKYYYRPEIIASKFLLTPDLWWLVLMINNMMNHREFCIPNIYMVNRVSLDKLSQILETTDKVVNNVTELKDLTLWPVKV